MRVCFIGETEASVAAYYRCILPMEGLRLRELDHLASFASVMVQLENNRLTGWKPPSLLPSPDVMVCRQMLNADGYPVSSADMFMKARDQGQQIFMDLDDNIWKLPEWNPAVVLWPASAVSTFEQDLQAATGVIVSSDPLADEVRQHTDTPVHVCRNGIDITKYPTRAYNPETLRLGWLGLMPYRAGGLQIAAEAIREYMRKHSHIEFIHLGYRSDHHPVSTILGDEFGERIRERPWVHYKYLSRELAQMDAVIIPSEIEPFTICRSTTTGMACLAGMTPFVATDIPEYRRLFEQGGGYVVDNDDWDMALRILCDREYASYRNEAASAGRALMASKYSVKETAKQWERVFENADP